MSSALIVDDNPKHLLALTEVFRREGFTTETLQRLPDARDALLRRMPDVALIKESVGDTSALDILSELDLSGVIEIFLMSDERNLETATRAMRLGVTDYFTIPVDSEYLSAKLKELNAELESGPVHDAASKSGRGLLIGESPPMQRLYRAIRKSAPSEATILIVGESGSGKELVAQTVHELSPRANRDFIAVNCAAIPQELMESELFGHKKGSFTGATQNHRGFFERASGGTLFLDEIAEMAPSLQTKLLRVLETKRVIPVGGEREIEVDPRIVAATNQDPKEAIDAGRLREDLYFRIAQFPMCVPPLRERQADIELLAQQFLADQNETRGIEKSFSDEALEALHLHDWPGNVRELKNAVLHGHLLAGEVITPADLPEGVPSTAPMRDGTRSLIGLSLAEVQRRHLLATLAHFDGDKKRASEVLGISLKTLYNRLKKYGVD